MAMRARVELRGALTHIGQGRKFKKGSPQILTNPAEIAYYKQQGGFSVTMMAAEKTKAKATEPTKPADDGGGDGGAEASYTEQVLQGKTKAELSELAAETWELELDPDTMKKDDMVVAMLKAQDEVLT